MLPCISNQSHSLYKMITTQLAFENFDNTTVSSLVNSRGMELAIIKVGGFGISGVTNEVTYFLPSVGKWKRLTTIPHVEQCNFGTAVLNNQLYVVGGCFNQCLQVGSSKSSLTVRDYLKVAYKIVLLHCRKIFIRSAFVLVRVSASGEQWPPCFKSVADLP